MNRFLKATVALAMFTASAANAGTYTLNTSGETQTSSLYSPGSSINDTYSFTVGNSSSLDTITDIILSAKAGKKTYSYDISDFIVSLYSSSGTFIANSDNDLGEISAVLSEGSYYLSVVGLASGVNGGKYTLTSTIAAVPEPETYALMGVGLLGLLAARRRKASSALAV